MASGRINLKGRLTKGLNSSRYLGPKFTYYDIIRLITFPKSKLAHKTPQGYFNSFGTSLVYRIDSTLSKIPIGRHKGSTFLFMANEDPGYMASLMSNRQLRFGQEVFEQLREIVNSKSNQELVRSKSKPVIVGQARYLRRQAKLAQTKRSI